MLVPARAHRTFLAKPDARCAYRPERYAACSRVNPVQKDGTLLSCSLARAHAIGRPLGSQQYVRSACVTLASTHRAALSMLPGLAICTLRRVPLQDPARRRLTLTRTREAITIMGVQRGLQYDLLVLCVLCGEMGIITRCARRSRASPVPLEHPPRNWRECARGTGCSQWQTRTFVAPHVPTGRRSCHVPFPAAPAVLPCCRFHET